MGTADTPAAPMQGLILLSPFRKRFNSFANKTPPAVLKQNATRPNARIASVSPFRNFSPSIVAPTMSPRKIVTMLIRGPLAVLLSRCVTPDSRIRLPNISMPISGPLAGMNSTVITQVAIGKTMTAPFETSFACGMSISRSLWVVNSLMIGGWITGTSAM